MGATFDRVQPREGGGRVTNPPYLNDLRKAIAISGLPATCADWGILLDQADRTITRVNPGKENLTFFNAPLSRSSNSSAGLLSSKDDAVVKKTNSDLFVGFVRANLNGILDLFKTQ